MTKTMHVKSFLFCAGLCAMMLSNACAQTETNNNNTTGNSYQNVDVPAFKALMTEPEVVLLDVRTPAEIAQGKLEGAVELNFNSPDFAEKVAQLDKSKTYLVYCRSGNRSGKACTIMQQQGFGHLYNLNGGMLEWGK
jgi:phage shock protein E